MTPLPANPDVIVVGAGVAGLAAGAVLREAGLQVVVLEAAKHIGGRCVTDSAPFSVPFDKGASWLHAAPANPLARVAERTDARLHKKHWRWSRVRIKDKNLTPEEIEDFGAYQDRMWQAIDDAGAVEPDTTTGACLPDGRWSETAVHYIPQMLAGDADTTSARDVRNYDHHDGDWLVGGGLGAFIKDLHGDLPVRTNCPVHKIDTTGSGVRVTTPDGVLEAAHLILTVSTGVLASGSIQFIPALPARKRDAIGMLPMGGMNKIAIEFDRDWTEMTEGQMADYHKGGDAYCSVLFGLYGSSLSVGFVAGRCADALEANGPGATTDLCLEALQAHFGSTITQNIRATQETAWRRDPFIQGAYSYAKPGGSDARRVLAEPIADRLFFAGEATMTHTYATVHGAWLSGQRSAEQVLALHAPAPSRQAG